MTLKDIAYLDMLEIKSLPLSVLEDICSQPRPIDRFLSLRWGDAQYALSLRRCPRKPSH